MPALSFQTQKAFIFLLLSAISGTAWYYLVSQHQTMNLAMMTDSWMPPQAYQAWSLIDFTRIVSMWTIMMIAMMMPSVMPMVFGFMGVRRLTHFNSPPIVGAIVFVGGYFLIWLVFCLAATVLQWQLHRLDLISPMMESRNTVLSAELILLAGFYQWTPWKAACLDHCRTTVYLTQDCHHTPIMMGVHHGLYCVGSCWALMFLMFAVGVMNLWWMGVLTLMVVVEKILPIKPIWLRCCSGGGLVIWGACLMIPLNLIARGVFGLSV